MTEFSQHEADRGETQERQGIAGEVGKVLGQSPAAVERNKSEAPSNKVRWRGERRAGDGPTPWENREALGAIRPFDDFDLEVPKRLGQSLLNGP
jgi:hypothetical protein